MIPQVKDLALERSCVSHGMRRCGKVGDIVSKWKLHDEERDYATRAEIEISWLEELRAEEIMRCKQEDRATHRDRGLAARRAASRK